ncbi:MAG TPA: SRPBCC family protein [Longimicrobium sp.]|jgi:uncharacterized protein YndB with AHSA1/START domain|uniref:SRPBCC family protein n=1 Tax=Longimicrobium sp. TaxID=2029185 RepID=UPI002EDA7218
MTTAEAASTTAATGTEDRVIVLTRVFDAPRELVFQAYTQPEHLAKWYGPDGFTITTFEHDCRVGGRWRFMMHGPDGKDWPNRIEYREVVRPERLVFDHGSDVDDDPHQFFVTITFDDEGGKTRLTSRMLMRTREQREASIKFGAVELGQQTLRRLAEYLETMRPS